ncbi:hypothetical protein PDL07_26955 [Bacillus cereus]|uniref:hypothetical protein n=1 Tax=Bacillus cereus TaxID=1396 RepID=UPI002ABF79B4|nr:hypothetical protein [Bacillus cereus]MDA1786293.1 hypothetical protein [Bacillus cereus]MDZ4536660.1 hypothetical protein [Bacillus cereus]
MKDIKIVVNNQKVTAHSITQTHLDTPIPEPGKPTRYFTVITGAFLFDPVAIKPGKYFELEFEVPAEHIQDVIEEAIGTGNFTTEVPFNGNWITVGFTAKWNKSKKIFKCTIHMYRVSTDVSPGGQEWAINYQLFIHHRK